MIMFFLMFRYGSIDFYYAKGQVEMINGKIFTKDDEPTTGWVDEGVPIWGEYYKWI